MTVLSGSISPQMGGAIRVPIDRGSMVQYLLRMMNLDKNTIAADPRTQQIVIENIDAIKQWLFQ